MAIRIHVTAARDCPPAEVRVVMSEVIKPPCSEGECAPVGDQLEISSNAGWTWFSTSVWGVSATDLNRGLCKLARPALQFTTSDGDRWYLTVHGGKGGQVFFLHEFSAHAYPHDPDDDEERMEELTDRERPEPVDPRLEFLEEDPSDEPERPKAPFDLLADGLKEMGANIPDEFRASVAGLSYSAAANRYRAWHAEQVINALVDAGIPHDPAAVRAVLLWENVTDKERGSDLGNLPRLLSVLGLGETWDQYVQEAEAAGVEDEEELEYEESDDDDEEAEEETQRQTRDLFGPVTAIVGHLPLAPLVDGPFLIPSKDMTLFRFFVDALSIHDTAGVVLEVTLPDGFDLATIPSPEEDGPTVVEKTARGFRVGLGNHLDLDRDDLKDALGKKLLRFLDRLPDGSTIDLAFARADKPALTQRYRGPVSGALWGVQETFPALTREALTEAMKLARHAEKEHEKHQLRDEAEAEAVVRLAAVDPLLQGMKVERDGRTIRCETDIVGHLPKVIFRHRFAGLWDVAAHDREAERLLKEALGLRRKMREAGVADARRRAAPHEGAVLFRGKTGPFWRSDFTLLDELEQETRSKNDEEFGALGFRHLGDLVAKKQRDIVMRAYTSADGLVHACLLGKRTMYLGLELFSRFADGSTLTTTTNASIDSKPLLRVFAKTFPGMGATELHLKHRWGIERFRTRKGTSPVPFEPTLLDVAREFDRVLSLREGVGLRFRIIATPPGEAPAKVRAGWIGCVLPLFGTTDDESVGGTQSGVVSRTKVKKTEGFATRSSDAVDVLESHDPDAARWWRERGPGLLGPGKLFVFDAKVCELVGPEGSP